VAAGNSSWYVMIVMLDENGYLFRAPMGTALDTATTGWKTFTAKLSDMDNTQWEASGRAANMAKIAQVSLRIMNDGDFAADGTQVFLLDNVRFVSETGALQETVLEDFESYADTAAVNAEWVAAFGRPCTAELNTTDPYAGSQSYEISPDFSGVNVNYGREFVFSATQDFSTAKYMKLAMKGDSALSSLNPTAHIFLKDATGNIALSYIWDWPGADEWSNMFLTFQGTGIAAETATSTIWKNFQWDAGGDIDLSIITSMIIAIETQDGGTYPVTANIVFDDIILGDSTQDEPIPSDKIYDGAKVASAPTIDGVLTSGEWDEASPSLCSGFVHHDNPALPATEDPTVQMVYDDTYMYVCWQVTAATLVQDFSPNPPGDDTDSSGNKFPMFFSPEGPMGDGFYRISLVPNPGDGVLYTWDEAATSKGYPGVASWDADNDIGAFTYDSGTGLLTMEYRIPWTDFDLPGLVQTGAPADSTEWGVQLGYTNDPIAEYVNWEPDDTPGYVMGKPFGTWTFTGTILDVPNWDQY
jgi:hypothetical protein